MRGQDNLRVHLEFGDIKVDFEGDVNQVTESIIRFLTEVYPNLEILRKLVYNPDVTNLAAKLVGRLEITAEGPILVSGSELSARDAVCIVLLGAYIGNKLGKLPKESLSSGDLAKITGKARKTMSNELPRLVDDGLTERTSEGEYELTILGIRKTEEMLIEKQPARLA
jgi:DNA-binding transcriptional ArsR family regulator